MVDLSASSRAPEEPRRSSASVPESETETEPESAPILAASRKDNKKKKDTREIEPEPEPPVVEAPMPVEDPQRERQLAESGPFSFVHFQPLSCDLRRRAISFPPWQAEVYTSLRRSMTL
jgi:hypothetical protein